MFQPARKKRFYSIKVSVLVIAIFGTFAFSITETNTIELAGNKPYPNSIFSPVNHTIDWLSEDTHTVGRAGKTSSSAIQNGLLMPVEIHSNGEHFIFFSAHTAKSNYSCNNKNTIQLKLRI
ncbi:MAG: hypothetical protein LBC76_04825 [Treponema sp.]|jgi:hypothetical protein|nr:hypothetical protein [Treponema sp.]